jgi:hypothetical protein
MQGAGSFQ